METITKTSVSRIAYYFVHYGKKSLLIYHPIDQFKGMAKYSSQQKGYQTF